MKIIGFLKADADSEAGKGTSPELVERIGAFMGEVMAAGVLIGGDGLLPSSHGKRMALKDGKFTVTDGPFTESKEIIASYAMFEVKSMDEAVEWSRRFLEVLGGGECELRPIFEGDPSQPHG